MQWNKVIIEIVDLRVPSLDTEVGLSVELDKKLPGIYLICKLSLYSEEVKFWIKFDSKQLIRKQNSKFGDFSFRLLRASIKWMHRSYQDF